MKIEDKKDLRLVSRGLREGWEIPAEAKTEIIQSLMEIIRQKDPDMIIDAIDMMRKIDELNAKREALQQRQLGEIEDRRVQLIAVAERLGIGGPDCQPSNGANATDPGVVDAPAGVRRKDV